VCAPGGTATFERQPADGDMRYGEDGGGVFALARPLEPSDTSAVVRSDTAASATMVVTSRRDATGEVVEGPEDGINLSCLVLVRSR
jgi:hypothetical protein